METVGIRLSVCLSVSVRQACLVDSTLAVSTVVVSSRSVALSASAIQLFYICGPDLGDDPHISVIIVKDKSTVPRLCFSKDISIFVKYCCSFPRQN